MKHLLMALALSSALAPMAQAQFSVTPDGGPPVKTTFVRLSNNSNAILIEPEAANAKSRIAFVVTHPERINNFNYFTARTLPRYGYRAIAINYYGQERTYYELLAPIAAAIKHLRSLPGVEKVVLVGHSTGGAEVTAYQDVAENGAKACQAPERIYKCTEKEAEHLPKADGLLLMDANSGAPERITGVNPALDPHHPRQYNPALDLFNPNNGYDPQTGAGHWTPDFLKKFFSAQAATQNKMIDEAQARLAKLDKGEGEFRDDEPFIVAAGGLFSAGNKPEMAYINLMSKTHAPHKLLKADGTTPTQIIQLVKQPQMRRADKERLPEMPDWESVRSFLSFHALRLNSDYRMTEDNLYGVQWRSVANSLQGNIQGIHVPTLIVTATCAPHTVYHEIAFDLSPAKDKEFVGVEGAVHGFTPCKPEFGDTYSRAFNYVDAWLSKPGRF